MPSQARMASSERIASLGSQESHPHPPVQGEGTFKTSATSLKSPEEYRTLNGSENSGTPRHAVHPRVGSTDDAFTDSMCCDEAADNAPDVVQCEISRGIFLLPNPNYLSDSCEYSQGVSPKVKKYGTISDSKQVYNPEYEAISPPLSLEEVIPLQGLNLGEPRTLPPKKKKLDNPLGSCTSSSTVPKSVNIQKPLKIETSGYKPELELISPTLPLEALQDDLSLQRICQLDREIAKLEYHLSIHKKKLAVLERSNGDVVPIDLTLAQKIYGENRRKAKESHAVLEKLGPKYEAPLYNQPIDNAVFQENLKKHEKFRGRLIKHLRRKNEQQSSLEKYYVDTYTYMFQKWSKKVSKVENSQDWKRKESRNRTIFEKEFPELRKKREEKDRMNRIGMRNKSEADLKEIIERINEDEAKRKRMFECAVIPPLPIEPRIRRISEVYERNRSENLLTDGTVPLKYWTQSEMQTFKDKFRLHKKKFGVIASYLQNKSVGDCIEYYYLSKHEHNYKKKLPHRFKKSLYLKKVND